MGLGAKVLGHTGPHLQLGALLWDFRGQLEKLPGDKGSVPAHYVELVQELDRDVQSDDQRPSQGIRSLNRVLPDPLTKDA